MCSTWFSLNKNKKKVRDININCDVYFDIDASEKNMAGAHHVDLRFSTNEDPKWLQDVREREVHIISQWISQYYHTLYDSSNN